ncbi:MAG: hypothetical protein GF333_06860 [Candidatus Omnitrophica bacterium]|nr:hypothetical protein [Candidatus Omnitrophota bacterium]
MKRYEFIEHTADLRLRIYGRTLPELFCHAAIALFETLVDHSPAGSIQKNVSLDSNSPENLLIDWLNELLSSFYAEQFLPRDIDVRVGPQEGGYALTACLRGDSYDPYAEPLKTEVKAATYHQVKIEADDGNFSAEIIFDV